MVTTKKSTDEHTDTIEETTDEPVSTEEITIPPSETEQTSEVTDDSVTSTDTTNEEIPPVSTDENTSEVTDSEKPSDQPKHVQDETAFRHQQALAAGFANTEQHETFLKQKQVAAQQGMPEPVGPTAPYPGAENAGVSAEQKAAIAKQAQQKQATQGNEK